MEQVGVKKMSSSYVDAFQRVMEAEANPEQAVSMKRYMRDQFEFLGIPNPQSKVVTARFLKQHGVPDQTQLEEVVSRLWELPQREYQYYAINLLVRTVKHAPQERLQLVERLIVSKSWWDTVDALASNVIGPLLSKYPELIEASTSSWIHCENIWLQRTAILFQLKYKNKTDTRLLAAMIEECLDSKEFFLQKAIGWALREYSKTDPEMVRSFVESHPLASLSKREALKVINRFSFSRLDFPKPTY
ncbi:MAG: alkylation repair protein [Paenibacillus sp.]|nr:alkylation repair protein [Paenibacillus sp.]